MNDARWAWMAGLFEGEGSFRRVPKGTGPNWHLRMDSTDEDVIRSVHLLCGGKVYGPVRNAKSTKDVWRWSLHRQDEVLVAVTEMRPWLHARRGTVADEALSDLRAWLAREEYRQMFCQAGHLWAENEIRRQDGSRYCRTCENAAQRRRRKER